MQRLLASVQLQAAANATAIGTAASALANETVAIGQAANASGQNSNALWFTSECEWYKLIGCRYWFCCLWRFSCGDW